MMKQIKSMLMPRFSMRLIGFIWLLSFVFVQNIKAQPEPKFTTFYYDKVSMFEILPLGTDEIVFLGDSITERCEWNELFSDNKIIQRGISGDITEGVLFRLSEVIKRKPKKIFLMIGVNDLRRGFDIDTVIIKNYETILNRIRSESRSTKIFLQSVLPVNNSVKEAKTTSAKVIELNKKIEYLAGKNGARYIDLFSSFTDKSNNLREELTSDGLHINGKGYVIWKSIIDKNKLLSE